MANVVIHVHVGNAHAAQRRVKAPPKLAPAARPKPRVQLKRRAAPSLIHQALENDIRAGRVRP